MNIEKIKIILTDILKNYEYKIYSIKPKKEFGEKILEILLKGKNINTNVLEIIHTELVSKLEDGDLPDDYYLEISSLGAEYPLETLEEIKDEIGKYIYLETEKIKLMGLLEEVNENELTIKYNNKGQFRKIKIEYGEVLRIRTSVKI